MDSFLSGFSQHYDGTQIGHGYTGNSGQVGMSGVNSVQVADVTQLQPGDTFQGEIVSVNGEDVQIQLTNGQYMAAKLERDVQVALGQLLNLQVQSNKDNRIVLKPVYDSRMQMLRVGESALRAAHMAVSDKNLTLVSKLIENGMSINKNTLMTFNRLSLQNPTANMADLIKLTKLHLPINDNSLIQLNNYQNMEHKLLDGIKEASDEILKLYDTLTGKASGEHGNILGQTAFEIGGKFMEQVLKLLSGEEGQTSAAGQSGNAQENQNIQAENVIKDNVNKTENIIKDNTQTASPSNIKNESLRNVDVKNESLRNADVKNESLQNADIKNESLQNKNIQDENVQKNNSQKSSPRGTIIQENDNSKAVAGKIPEQQSVRENKTLLQFINQLKGEQPQTLTNKIISFIKAGIKDGGTDIRDFKQLLLDSDIGKQLTTEQKSEIFHSEPFKLMLKNGLQKQWTLTPQDLTQEGKVEEFYQKLVKESNQLARMMNEAMQESGQGGNAAQTRAMTNINENVEFMNQMNQMFNYVQLPLKLSNSDAHGDLYVYTNKKNLARGDGLLTAFLHLDMDNLGSLDISIALQTEKSNVTTKFYLDESSIALVEGHIDELAQRLSKKGYQCKNMILEKEENKTVIEHMEEQVAGGSAVLSYQTFDTRA